MYRKGKWWLFTGHELWTLSNLDLGDWRIKRDVLYKVQFRWNLDGTLAIEQLVREW